MTDNDSLTPLYSIGTVQKMADLTGRQIRYYEQCCLIKPKRSSGNRRLFSKKDVKKLCLIKELLKKGLTIEGIKREIKESSEKSGERQTSYTDNYLTADEHVTRIRSLYPVTDQAALTEILRKKRQQDMS